MAQKEYISPPEPSMRLVIDTFEFGVKNTPKFNTISISGYHIREAGSTAIQELAFTLRDGLEYVEWGMHRGLDVEQFVPQLSFFFNAHNDFFGEIAKYRAARRIWHKAMVARGAREYIDRIDAMGGMVAAIERSYPQREIAEASYRYQVAVDKKEKIIVGVNDFVAEEKPLDILQID